MVRSKVAIGLGLIGFGLGVLLTAIVGTSLCVVILGIGALVGGFLLLSKA